MSISPTVQQKGVPSASLDVIAHFIDPLLALQFKYKLFVLSCLAEHQRTQADLNDIIDQLDPEAAIDANCCEFIERLCQEPANHQFVILNFLTSDLATSE